MHQIFNKRGIHVYILNLLCIKFNQQPIKHATYSHTASSCITGNKNIVRFKYSNFRQVQPAYSKKICNLHPSILKICSQIYTCLQVYKLTQMPLETNLVKTMHFKLPAIIWIFYIKSLFLSDMKATLEQIGVWNDFQ